MKRVAKGYKTIERGGGEGGKTIEIYSLKTYINAQHFNLFSVYILLLRS